MHITQEDLDNRFTYHSPQDSKNTNLPGLYGVIRSTAKKFAELIVEECPASRETSLAVTKLEEAVFWANAALARQNAG